MSFYFYVWNIIRWAITGTYNIYVSLFSRCEFLKDSEEIWNVLQNLDDDDELAHEVDGSKEIELALIPPRDGADSNQFIRGKPIRYGFKWWCVCSSKGYLIWFEPYTGAGGKDIGRMCDWKTLRWISSSWVYTLHWQLFHFPASSADIVRDRNQVRRNYTQWSCGERTSKWYEERGQGIIPCPTRQGELSNTYKVAWQ